MSFNFFFQSVTNETFGGGYGTLEDIIDPFERKNLKLSQSLAPDSGEGKLNFGSTALFTTSHTFK